jgi:presenilin-like A22 family membrane protease
MPETASADEHALPPPDLRRDAPALLGMAALFLVSIGLAMAFSATFLEQNLQAFENPDDPVNALIYLGIVVVFTVVILLIAKYGKRVIIKYIILASVLMTVFYVAAPLLSLVMPGTGGPTGFGVAGIVGLLLAIGLTLLLFVFPEWYVIDAVGVLVAAGAAGIFGISFGLLPSLVLLVVFAVYDAIAVYRTKHMLDLADSVLELRLPIMYVVPKTWDYSFLEETRRVKDPSAEENRKPREAMFMGLGDAVIPGVLVVSALTFLSGTASVAGVSGPLVVALATLAGSFVGFCALMYFVMKGRPHAGLPLLNGGAILGFFLALLPLYGLAPLNPFG